MIWLIAYPNYLLTTGVSVHTRTCPPTDVICASKPPHFRFVSNAIVFSVIFSVGVIVQACTQVSSANESAGRFNVVLHDELIEADVTHLVSELVSNYERIRSDLSVESLPTITIQIWRDETRYQNEMELALGARFPGSRGYVVGNSEFRLLLRQRKSGQKEAIHEFAHVVSLNLNPSFGNNPRWLWEAVALYEAEQFRDPKDIDYIRNRDFPAISNLNTDFGRGNEIYDLGYLLIDYVVARWNRNAVVELIRSNGDIPLVLKVNEEDFEKGWFEYVEQHYLNNEH